MLKRLLVCLLLTALLTASAAGAYLPAAEAASPDVYSAGEQITGIGVDVSQFQGDIDWGTAARSIDFAIIRCYARGQADQKWNVNAAACERLGIPYGAYVYSAAKTDAQARSEAEGALQQLRGKSPRLPVYLDLEDESVRTGCTKAEILRHATIFCDTLRAAGYSVGIYANRYWWTTVLDDPAYEQWDRWLAVWDAETGYSGSYSTWQCSNSARIPGIPTNVDLNLRYGTSLNAGHTHDYRVTKHTEPSCTDFGSRIYTCGSCGASVTQPLRPLRSCPSKNLSDVPTPGNWAHAGIDFCVRTGLMSGVGSGRFDPKGTTTRAQAVQVLYELSGAPKVSGKTPFTELTHGWYQSAVLWAYQTGVTSGMSETTFAPDDPVTREQVTVFLAAFADRVLDRYTPYMWDALFPFQDRESISYYARTAMNWACNLGVIKGIPAPGGLRLEPQGYATREQMAVMLAQFCRELNVWNEPMPEI